MCICATGKNPGGRDTKKQCSLCKAAGRDGTGHRAPSCPFRDLDDVWVDPSQPRFPDAAKEADARAALAAQKLKDKAAVEQKVSVIDLKTKEMQKAAKKLKAEREALSKERQEQEEEPPSTPAEGKPAKRNAKRQAAGSQAGDDGSGISPHDKLAAKKMQRDAVRAHQEAEREVKRLRRLADQLQPIGEEDETAGTAGTTSQVSRPPNLPL